jgi:hypothetical protein
MTSHSDLRLLLIGALVNWFVGFLIIFSLLFIHISGQLLWHHALLFFTMPIICFMYYLRDSRISCLPTWQVIGNFLFQMLFMLLPWAVLIDAYVH